MSAPFRTCLLIDDNPVDVFINRSLILRCKFADEVITFKSAEALDLIRAGTIHPNVIFMDLKMPGMDGFQFLQEYAKIDIHKDNIKIFILSSTYDPEEINQIENNKYVNRFIKKNLTTEILNSIS